MRKRRRQTRLKNRGGGRIQPASPPVPVSSARNPELEVLLGKLSDYVQGYTGHYSALVAEESYRQSVPFERQQRRLRSDLLFVRSEPSTEWVSFRDVFEVDGKPVRDRDLRLEKLFLSPAPEARARLEAIRDESARYNLRPIVRTINVPLYPLKILLPENRGRFVFSLGQAAEAGGVKVRSVAFTEVGRPALIRDLEGNDVPVQGPWLQEFLPGIPADGRATWLTPEVVTDPSDPKLAHLDGLNLSRAWMMEGIASGLPPGDPRLPAIRVAAARHRERGLAAVTGEHYEGGHWLGSFATYLATGRGLPGPPVSGPVPSPPEEERKPAPCVLNETSLPGH